MKASEQDVYASLGQLGIEEATAKELLESLAKLISAGLRDKNTYEVEGFGVFQLAESNGTKQIHFQPNSKFLKEIS